jgi:hypothetical protein
MNPQLGVGALNVHYFDGQLKEMYGIFSQDFLRVRNLREEKILEFQKLQELLISKNASQLSMKFLNMIIQTFIRNGRENYDSSNDVYACDILYLICENMNKSSSDEEKEEYLSLLISQLEEMTGGACPPGRTTRLFQVLAIKLNLFYNDKSK